MIINFFDINSRNPKQRKKILKKSEIKFTKNYKNFGYDYFDNNNLGIGYGSYNYDGRFKEPVKSLVNYYNLSKNSKILEIGCAKGYILKEFYDLGMNVYGLDFSKYAVKHAHSKVKHRILNWNITKGTTYLNHFFDFIFCKETLPHIDLNKIPKLINELNRIVKNKKNIFLEIQTSSTNKGLNQIKLWDETHKTLLLKNDWIKLLKDSNYEGDLYFKNLI